MWGVDMKAANIKKIIKDEFERELEEVVQKYPLVGAALVAQQKGLIKCSRLSEIGECFAEVSLDTDTAMAIGFLLIKNFRDFERALGSAKTDGDVKDAFEKFCEGWLGGENGGRPYECPDCEGTGKTSDGKECERCGGNGFINPFL
jgi:hypothetical protein